MDVILDQGFVNDLLGWMYGLAALSLIRFVHHCMKANPRQYMAVMGNKGFIVSLFFLMFVTCATVSYQNFFMDFGRELLWGRLGLITSITYLSIRLGTIAKVARKVIFYGEH